MQRVSTKGRSITGILAVLLLLSSPAAQEDPANKELDQFAAKLDACWFLWGKAARAEPEKELLHLDSFGIAYGALKVAIRQPVPSLFGQSDRRRVALLSYVSRQPYGGALGIKTTDETRQFDSTSSAEICSIVFDAEALADAQEKTFHKNLITLWGFYGEMWPAVRHAQRNKTISKDQDAAAQQLLEGIQKFVVFSSRTVFVGGKFNNKQFLALAGRDAKRGRALIELMLRERSEIGLDDAQVAALRELTTPKLITPNTPGFDLLSVDQLMDLIFPGLDKSSQALLRPIDLDLLPQMPWDIRWLTPVNIDATIRLLEPLLRAH